jgi:uncharacterized membrane protein YqhA
MFERAICASRLLVLVAVVASIVLALGAFWIALVDVFHCLRQSLALDPGGPTPSCAARR